MGEKKHSHNSRKADVIIIGGGAAGMMAGILAARKGLRVSILEKNRHFGKKLGITGNGKCNFTNAYQAPECYRSDTPQAAWNIVKRFPVSETLHFFQEIGIEPWKRGEGYYPASELAGDMTKALLSELERLSVTCRTNVSVQGILPEQEGFLVQTEGYAYPASCVLLAAGGLAAPQYGSEGDGYKIAEQLGHVLIPPCPALTALKVGTHPLTRLAGLRRIGKIRICQKEQGEPGGAGEDGEYLLCIERKKSGGAGKAGEDREHLLCTEQGELQFTSYGISGIPAMQVSRFAARALERGASVWATLDVCPEQTIEEVISRIHRRSEVREERSLSEWFAGWLPEKLGEVLAESVGLNGKQIVKNVTKEEWNRLAVVLKGWRVPITGVRSYDAAQTTAGGVSLLDCTEDLESKWVPGLFFAGEMLDVDGACGGYNLQWAWSSAACAVEGICKKVYSENKI